MTEKQKQVKRHRQSLRLYIRACDHDAECWSPVMPAILMTFMTRYTSGSRQRADAATLTLVLAYKLPEDLHDNSRPYIAQ